MARSRPAVPTNFPWPCWLLVIKLPLFFFYGDGVLNANRFTLPASDEFDLVRAWQQLANVHQVPLNVCVSAGLRRGIVASTEVNSAVSESDAATSLQAGFTLTGLGALAEALLTCDRTIQF